MLNEKLKYVEDIFNNLVEAVITTDMDLVINGWNKAAEKMYGWKKDEVIGKIFEDILKPEYFGETRESVFDKFFKDEFYKGEAVCKRKDGSDVIVFSSVSMITDNKGNNIGIVAINRDITEQKKTEEELRKSEEKFRIAFHTSPDAVNINRLSDGKYVEINDGFTKMSGYKKSDVLGKTSLELGIWVNPRDRQNVVDKLTKEGKVYNYEAQFRMKDGSIKTGVMSAHIIELNGEKHILSITRDITQQKEAELRLRESEERFRRFFENEPEYCYMVSPGGIILDVNKSALNTLGYKKNEMVGKPIQKIYAPESLSKVDKLFDKWKKTGRLRDEELELITKNGERRTVLLSASAVKDKDGNILHSISIQRDITERKKIEKELAESEQKFKDLTEKSLVGVYLIVDGKFKYVNPKVAEIFGYKVDEMIDKLGPDDLTFPSDRERVLQNISKRIKGDINHLSYSFRGLKRDGSVIYLEVFGSRTSIGGEPAVVGTLLDITERKLIEDRLRKSEKRYRELFEFSPVALWEEDFTQLINYLKKLKEQGVNNFREYFTINPGEVKRCARLVTILDVNQAAVKLHEAKSKKEMLGGLEDLFTTEAYDNFKEELVQLAEGKNQIQLESRIETPGSKIKHVIVDIFVSEFEEDDNKVYRAFISSSDVTEMKLAEQSIRESETKFRNLAEYSPNMIFIFQDDRIVFANRMCEKVMGYSKEELYSPGFDFKILIDPEYIDLVLSNYQRYLKGEYVEPTIYSLKTRAGDKIESLINTSTITYEGKPAILGIITDITEQRKAEKRLRDSHNRIRNLAKKLQSIREEERAYIAREIHDDLGQSLTALKMDLSWMLKKIDEYTKDKLSIKIAEMLSLIDASIQNVKRIIYELRPSILDDLGLCPAIEWQSKEFERRTGINCSIVTDPNPVNLNTDLATAVFRIFQETLTNIARHSKAKNVSGSVLFKDNKVCLKVVDDGVGITEEQLNNHYSFGILGMKERAQMWDGTVDIKGIKNKGTEVVVEIPVK